MFLSLSISCNTTVDGKGLLHAMYVVFLAVFLGLIKVASSWSNPGRQYFAEDFPGVLAIFTCALLVVRV